MTELAKPPKTYDRFVGRYPELGQAWELMAKAGQAGPLPERTQRLLKLAVAVGAMREGAVHSGVRKSLAQGISAEEIEQVIALSASTLGMSSAAAVFTWVHDELDKAPKGP